MTVVHKTNLTRQVYNLFQDLWNKFSGFYLLFQKPTLWEAAMGSTCLHVKIHDTCQNCKFKLQLYIGYKIFLNKQSLTLAFSSFSIVVHSDIRSVPSSKSYDPYPHLYGGQTLGMHRLCLLRPLHTLYILICHLDLEESGLEPRATRWKFSALLFEVSNSHLLFLLSFFLFTLSCMLLYLRKLTILLAAEYWRQ